MESKSCVSCCIANTLFSFARHYIMSNPSFFFLVSFKNHSLHCIALHTIVFVKETGSGGLSPKMGGGNVNMFIRSNNSTDHSEDGGGSFVKVPVTTTPPFATPNKGGDPAVSSSSRNINKSNRVVAEEQPQLLPYHQRKRLSQSEIQQPLATQPPGPQLNNAIERPPLSSSRGLGPVQPPLSQQLIGQPMPLPPQQQPQQPPPMQPLFGTLPPPPSAAKYKVSAIPAFKGHSRGSSSSGGGGGGMLQQSQQQQQSSHHERNSSTEGDNSIDDKRMKKMRKVKSATSASSSRKNRKGSSSKNNSKQQQHNRTPSTSSPRAASAGGDNSNRPPRYATSSQVQEDSVLKVIDPTPPPQSPRSGGYHIR